MRGREQGEDLSTVREVLGRGQGLSVSLWGGREAQVGVRGTRVWFENSSAGLALEVVLVRLVVPLVGAEELVRESVIGETILMRCREGRVVRGVPLCKHV